MSSNGDKDKKWSGSAKVGAAAVGSAAIMAGLLFANRKRSRTVDSVEAEPVNTDEAEAKAPSGLDDQLPPETD